VHYTGIFRSTNFILSFCALLTNSPKTLNRVIMSTSHKNGELKVLFICLGNICRSPMAEAIFRAKTNGDGDLCIKWDIDSAAIGPWHVGKAPDRRCLNVLKEHGITTSHKARQIRAKDFTTYDYIFGMDNENRRDLEEETPKGATAAVKLLSEFDVEREGIIRDPYYDPDDKGFRHIYVQISRCLDGFLTHVKKTHIK